MLQDLNKEEMDRVLDETRNDLNTEERRELDRVLDETRDRELAIRAVLALNDCYPPHQSSSVQLPVTAPLPNQSNPFASSESVPFSTLTSLLLPPKSVADNSLRNVAQ